MLHQQHFYPRRLQQWSHWHSWQAVHSPDVSPIPPAMIAMAGWSHPWQSDCGPSSDLAELRQAKVVGPAGPAGTSSGVLPSATNQATGVANQRLGRAAPPTTNPGKRQHKPRQSTCRHCSPAAQALCCFLGSLLGLRRRRGRWTVMRVHQGSVFLGALSCHLTIEMHSEWCSAGLAAG